MTTVKNRIRTAPSEARRRTWAALTISRHGAIAAAQRVTDSRVASPVRLLVMMLVGSSFIGIGVSAFRAADLGLPPFDVLLSAIDQHTALSHGQAAWAVSGTLLLVAASLGQRARVTTVVFVLANGLAVDAAAQLLNPPDAWGLRIAMLGGGIASIAVGINLVVHSGLTGGSFELLMRAGQQRGVSPERVRLGLEVAVLATGIALGGSFGAGTVIFAAVIARVMTVVAQAMRDHRAGRHARLDARC